MTFAFPDGLAPEVYPLAWLVGEWAGTGVIEHPAVPRADVSQRMVFGHDGGPYLSYSSSISLVAEDGGEGQMWASESGFWRVAPSIPDGVTLDQGQFPLEVLIADASGVMSRYLGAVGAGRIDLATDLIARTPSGADITGATRLYGLVAGDLLWAWDITGLGHPMHSYASAKLARVEHTDPAEPPTATSPT